jgi:murein DD-endopeptidase MepM/ murein hydrolase activator NlpD
LSAGLIVYSFLPRLADVGRHVGKNAILGNPVEAATTGWYDQTAIIMESQPIAATQTLVGSHLATNVFGGEAEAGTYAETSLIGSGQPANGEALRAASFNSSFIVPADGFNWGKVHHYNAVDISNKCGTPIRASAEGLVVPDENFGSGIGNWNGGYGEFVLIEHPFGDGTRTRYAHLSKILVGVGDYVKQGQQIGIMGDTGDATGCHLHFEVYGAENPFIK